MAGRSSAAPTTPSRSSCNCSVRWPRPGASVATRSNRPPTTSPGNYARWPPGCRAAARRSHPTCVIRPSPLCSAMRTPPVAVSVLRRSSRRLHCWRRCCAPTSAPAHRCRSVPSDARARRWRVAVSTTSWPADSPAIASMPTGWFRTSKKCSTTTPCCCVCTHTGPDARVIRWPAASPPRRRHSSSPTLPRARCSPRRWMLTPPDQRGPPTCGRPSNFARCSAMMTDFGPQRFSRSAIPDHSSTEVRCCSCPPPAIRCLMTSNVLIGCGQR